tara:strand:+ start:234 stop:416 length:183 start_codon:yes stop_codon:yes gene_type:complete
MSRAWEAILRISLANALQDIQVFFVVLAKLATLETQILLATNAITIMRYKDIHFHTTYSA